MLRSVTVGERRTYQLDLEPDPARSNLAVKGSVKVDLGWEPARMCTGQFVSTPTIARQLTSSPMALRILRIALLGTAGLLLLVAAQARWLCKGESLASCVRVDVPGADTCASLGALCAFVAMVIHFAGTAGLLGAAWMGEPLSVLDMFETDDLRQEDQEDDGDQENPTFQMKVKSEGVLQWSVEVATSLLPAISLTSVRLVSMLTDAAAVLLCGLGIVLAWVEEGTSMQLGEAVYLDMAAVLCLAAGAAGTARERRLLAEAERERWRRVERPELQGYPEQASKLNMEAWADEAKRRVDLLKQETEKHLTKPLLDASQRVQERFESEVAKPFKQWHESLDSQGGVAPEWIPPFLAAMQGPPRCSSPTRTESAARRWLAGGLEQSALAARTEEPTLLRSPGKTKHPTIVLEGERPLNKARAAGWCAC